LGMRAPLALLATFLTVSVASAQQPPAAAPAKPAAAKPAPAAPKAEAKPSAAPKAESKPAPSAVGEVQPTLLGQYGDWGAYYASPGGKKICFAIAKPKSTQTNPAGRKRDPIWLFVSDRPAENVHNEVSVIIGYPFKSPSDATAEIGSAKFAMYTLNDGAWIKNVAEEARMIEAMRKGSDLTVKGMSGHGTESTDQYALKGLSQAMDKAEQECK
jgi:Invasion associated locus B (IalB) protein